MVGSAKGVLQRQSWEVDVTLRGEWRAQREEERNRSCFSRQAVKTNLKESKYRATGEKMMVKKQMNLRLGQVGWSFEQPVLLVVEGVPAHGRGFLIR